MNNIELKNLVFLIGNKADISAFNSIFDFFAPRIMGYLVSSGSKREFAEEITQETLSIVWQKAFQFNHKRGNVSTWIFTIARNKRIDRIRKNENPIYNTQDLIEALYTDKQEESGNCEEEILEMQSKLSEKEKKLIKMNFFEGKTHNFISRDLEIPLGTVKSRIRNTLLKMKKL